MSRLALGIYALSVMILCLMSILVPDKEQHRTRIAAVVVLCISVFIAGSQFYGFHIPW